jgi:hypothetical protein
MDMETVLFVVGSAGSLVVAIVYGWMAWLGRYDRTAYWWGECSASVAGIFLAVVFIWSGILSDRHIGDLELQMNRAEKDARETKKQSAIELANANKTAISALSQAERLRISLESVTSNTFEPAAYLTPGNDPTPSVDILGIRKDLITPSTIIGLLGSQHLVMTKLPFAVLLKDHIPQMIVERDSMGVYISAKLYDESGSRVICTINKTLLINNDNNRFKIKHDSPNRLVLINRDDNSTVIDVEFVNSLFLRILGDFYMRDGVHVVISKASVDFDNGNFVVNGVTLEGSSAIDYSTKSTRPGVSALNYSAKETQPPNQPQPGISKKRK